MTEPAFYRLTPEGARLFLRVTPNARTNRIEGPVLRPDGTCVLELGVAAPPDKGAANAAVLALLARSTGLPKSAFSLLSGQTGRLKTLALSGPPQKVADALARLQGR